jgi:hypothetical protein
MPAYVLRPLLVARSISGQFLGVIPTSIPVLIRVSAALAALYFATIIYGAAVGYALPSATIFRMPHADLISRIEASLPRILLVIAFAGTGLAWLAKAGLIDEVQFRRSELSGTLALRKYGFLIFVAAFLLALTCSSGWNGNIIANYGSGDSVMGLVPLVDAHAYYVSPVQQSVTGHWSAFASRRPFAAGFRELLLMAGGLSNLKTLLVQNILVAAALLLAVWSIVRWRGLWCGIAFGGLVYGIARPFLATMLTEPLGLFWVLLSVTFIVEAFRLSSVSHAYVALAAFTFAEITRMGSVFTIPALAMWIPIAFGSGVRKRVILGGVAAGVVGLVLIVQGVFAALYGNQNAVTGGNFAYTLCGLAVGQNWLACSHLFMRELGQLSTEREQDPFLLAKAFQLIQQNPYPMLARMLANVRDLVTGIPQFLLYGLGAYHRPMREFFFVLLLTPGFYLAFKCRGRGQARFWAFFFVTLAGSAALIFADDGWRTMHSTWPFVALFFSLGFTSPLTTPWENSTEPLISARAGASLVVVLVALTIVAPAIARFWPGAELMRTAQAGEPRSDQSLILEGRSVTGFLVVPDNTMLPDRVPAIHASQFVQLVKDLGLEENYGKFLDRAMARMPFALVTAARLDVTDDDHQRWNFLVAPPGILTNATQGAWKADIGGRTGDTGSKDLFLEIASIRSMPSGPQETR